MDIVHLKCKFGDTLRKFPVQKDVSFAQLSALLHELVGQPVRFAWVDNEGDLITVLSDLELHEAFAVHVSSNEKSLKLYLTPLDDSMGSSQRQSARAFPSSESQLKSETDSVTESVTVSTVSYKRSLPAHAYPVENVGMSAINGRDAGNNRLKTTLLTAPIDDDIERVKTDPDYGIEMGRKMLNFVASDGNFVPANDGLTAYTHGPVSPRTHHRHQSDVAPPRIDFMVSAPSRDAFGTVDSVRPTAFGRSEPCTRTPSEIGDGRSPSSTLELDGDVDSTEGQKPPSSTTRGPSSSEFLDADTPTYEEEELAMHRLQERIRGKGAAIKEDEANIRWRRGPMLGKGSFGFVYCALNLDDGTLMAIKEIKVESVGAERERLARDVMLIHKEVTLLRNLNHRNVVQFLGAQQAQDENGIVLYIMLEYVAGGSVDNLLRTYGPFEEALTRNYLRQLLVGLVYLHSLHIIHRDVKGANILVTTEGIVKLADFGATKIRSTKELAGIFGRSNTKSSIKGTPYWMAPEVVREEGFGRRADVWSVACTTIEMLTGSPPWRDLEPLPALFRIGSKDEPPPEFPEFLSDEGKDFLRLAFQRDPSKRPQSSQLLSHPFICGVGSDNCGYMADTQAQIHSMSKGSPDGTPAASSPEGSGSQAASGRSTSADPRAHNHDRSTPTDPISDTGRSDIADGVGVGAAMAARETVPPSSTPFAPPTEGPLDAPDKHSTLDLISELDPLASPQSSSTVSTQGHRHTDSVGNGDSSFPPPSLPVPKDRYAGTSSPLAESPESSQHQPSSMSGSVSTVNSLGEDMRRLPPEEVWCSLLDTEVKALKAELTPQSGALGCNRLTSLGGGGAFQPS